MYEKKNDIYNLLPFIKQIKIVLFLCLICYFAQLVVNILEANVTQYIFDTALKKTINDLLRYIPFIIAVVIFSMVVRFFSKYLNGIFSANLTKKLRTYIVKRLKEMPISFMEENDSGKVASAITNDLSTINDYFSQSFSDLISSLVLCIGISVYMIFIDWGLFLSSVVVLPIFICITNLLKKSTSEISRKENEYVSKSNSVLVDSLRGRELVKSYNLKGRMVALYKSNIDLALDTKIVFEKRRSIIGAMAYFIEFIPILICISYGGYQTINKVISVGQLLAFIQLLRQLTNIVSNLPDLFINLYRMYGASNHLFEVIEKSKERDDGIAVEINGHLPLIELKNVSFSYKTRKVISDLNLSITKGEKIALVGPSGSGKSTIIKLICGFYNDYEGTIKFTGKDLKNLNLPSVREKISIISQDIYMFPGTIEENIAFGKSDAAKDEIVKAAKIAFAHDFIMELPQGYDTNVNELGGRLSGGQRQRIAIARAILKDSPILILDEPTSALDAESENLIYDELSNYVNNKTVIIISHRFSSIKNVDKIYVINKGRLIEEGLHEELIKKESIYKKLFLKQSVV